MTLVVLYLIPLPLVAVKFVDVEGTNLIENASIDSDSIDVSGNFSNAGAIVIGPSEFNHPFENTLQLFIPVIDVFEYQIQLNEIQPVEINFEAKKVNIPCDISYYIPISVSRNTSNVPVEEIDPIQFLITIVL